MKISDQRVNLLFFEAFIGIERARREIHRRGAGGNNPRGIQRTGDQGEGLFL